MIRSSLNSILNLFNEEATEGDDELFRETVLMTLSRATNADSNIHPVEVNLVVEIVNEVTGETISTADVQVAARSRLYETAPLERYLASVGLRLSMDRKLLIVRALARVIKADERITDREVRFFNMVCDELRIRSSDLIGLIRTQAH